MPEFDAAIVDADQGGAYVVVPDDVVSVLREGVGHGRVPVTATFDGVAYHGSVVSMGGGRMVLGIVKAIRHQLAKQPGDVVHVVVERVEST